MNDFIKLLSKEKGNIVISENPLFEDLFSLTLNEKYLYDISFKSFVEVIHDTLGGYDIEGEYYLAKELGITFEGSNIYLDSFMLADIENKEKAKDYYVAPLGLDNYFDKNVIVVKPRSLSNLYYKALKILEDNGLSISYYNFSESEEKNHYLTEAETMIEEVENAAEEISGLIFNGVKPDDIKIEIEDDSYKKFIDDIFPFYHIEYYFNERKHLNELEDVGHFYNYVMNSNNEFNCETLDKYAEDYEIDPIIRKHLKSVLTGFTSMDPDYFKYTIGSLSIQMPKYRDAVEISLSALDKYIHNDEYVFVLGANQGSFPKPVKETGVLPDEILKKNGLLSYKEMNSLSEEYLLNKIKSIRNLYISYKLKDEAKEYLKSSILDRIPSLKIKKTNDSSIRFSYKRDIIKYFKAKDLYTKYNACTEDYKDYYSIGESASLLREDFDDKMNITDKDMFKEYLNGSLKISYTAMDSYFACPQKFLYDNIFKLNPFEENYGAYLGTFFHNFMEEFFEKEYDQVAVDELYEKHVRDEKENKGYQLDDTDMYYFKKFYEALPIIHKEINTKFDKSNYAHNASYKEKKFHICDNVNGFNIVIKGSIDLVLEDNSSNLTIVDYKTGEYHNPDLENKKGLQMLIYYIYYNEENGNKYKPFACIYQAIDKKNINKLKIVSNSGFYIDDAAKMEYINPSKEALPRTKYKPDDFRDMIVRTKELVHECIEDITDLKFNASLNKNACRYCSFKDLCDSYGLKAEDEEEEDTIDGTND